MSLYKFHAFNENSISALEAYSAWFAKPASFNDPFEGLYKEKVTTLNDNLIAELADTVSKKHPELKDIFISHMGLNKTVMLDYLTRLARDIVRSQQKNFYESGVCCFISDEKVHPFENPLMWGHYGNGLKGYMLQIDHDINYIFEDKRLGAVPVVYKSEPPSIYCLELMKQHLEKGTTASEIIKVMSTKSKEWEYENEIRFISFMNGNGLFKYTQGAIKSIVIGSKMPEWQKRTIKAIADKHKITDLKEAFSRDDSYKVGLRALSI
ncbi:DUF2971 domain-containing protein [Aeromonas salmonicida]